MDYSIVDRKISEILSRFPKKTEDNTKSLFNSFTLKYSPCETQTTTIIPKKTSKNEFEIFENNYLTARGKEKRRAITNAKFNNSLTYQERSSKSLRLKQKAQLLTESYLQGKLNQKHLIDTNEEKNECQLFNKKKKIFNGDKKTNGDSGLYSYKEKTSFIPINFNNIRREYYKPVKRFYISNLYNLKGNLEIKQRERKSINNDKGFLGDLFRDNFIKKEKEEMNNFKNFDFCNLEKGNNKNNTIQSFI